MTRDGSDAAFRVQPTDTVRQTLSTITQAFAILGIDDAPADARFLVQGILEIDALTVLREPDRPIGARAEMLERAVYRRLTHEPVSRILGARAFFGRTFQVTPDVLDPRADTETLVELVLDILRSDGRQNAVLTIADIGAGSGAIIVTLLAELPNAVGIAIDISPAALAITKANAARFGVLDRLTLVETSGLRGINDKIDVVVSNPPYIRAADIAGLDPGVRNFDPHLALDGGDDGLAIYREIASDIREITTNSRICLEIGAGQCDDVEQIFRASGCTPCHRRTDLGGHIRAVALQIQREPNP